MATKKQPVMKWTDDHDILLLREMIASELFQFKKGSPDRGKIWESIQERLNKLDHPKFTIKEKSGVRDRWNLLQAKFERINERSFNPVGLIVYYPKRMRSEKSYVRKRIAFLAKARKVRW